MVNKFEFSVTDLKCDKVTVFKQEAEIVRLLKFNLPKGDSRIVIHSISSCVDVDSIRFDPGNDLVILDVTFESETEDTDSKVKQSESVVSEIELELNRVNCNLSAVNNKIENLDLFFKNLTKKCEIDSFLSFNDLYVTKLESLSSEKMNLEKLKNDLEDRLTKTREEHDSMLFNLKYKSKLLIKIDIWSEKETKANMLLSYLVNNVSWSPKYNIRAFPTEKIMTVAYYGLINQTTGEDWTNVKLTLSTAEPFVGPSVPELATQNIRSKPSVTSLLMQGRRPTYQSSVSALRRGSEMISTELGLATAQVIEEPKINSIGLTSSLDILDRTSILSDGTTSKVEIVVIELKPEFLYEICPRLNKNAYIKAKAKNTWSNELLSGPANVYLNNNFVSKTELKSYAPGEEIICSLGVDDSIKVDYKPGKIYTYQTGLINKTLTSTYVQVIVIEVRNLSSSRAKILLVENLPCSSDERVQVRLLEPVLGKNQNSVRLNKANNLEFDLDLASDKTDEVLIKYTIESPSNCELEFY